MLLNDYNNKLFWVLFISRLDHVKLLSRKIHYVKKTVKTSIITEKN